MSSEPDPTTISVREFRMLAEETHGLVNPTKNQLAALAVISILPKLMDEAKKRRFKPAGLQAGQSSTLAAKVAGVGTSMVNDALVVRKKNPELFNQVLKGEVTLQDAKHNLKHGLPKEARRRKPRQMEVDYAKRQMIEGLSRIRGLCRGLSSIGVTLVAAAGLNAEERRTWVMISFETSRQLRDFGQKLKAVRNEKPDHQNETD